MRKDMEEALEKFQVKTFGNKKNIERAESELMDDEKVLFIIPTNATITTKRFLFLYKVYKVLLSHNIETGTLDTINSINCSGNGLTTGHVQIHTITKSYDIIVSYKKNYKNDTFLSAKETYDNNLRANDSSSIGNTDIVAQIEKLSELRDKNILSEKEFETKKAELLSRL